MGLNNRQKNVQYVRLKEGKFYLSSDKEFKQPFDELEGKIVDMFFKDEEYKGNTTRKLYVVVQDGEDKYIFGLNFEASYCTKFLSFLKNADLTKNLVISPSVEEVEVNGDEVNRTTIFISQNGKNLKAFYTKDNPNGLPAMKRIKVGNKYLWDKEDMLNFLEDVVTKEFKPQFSISETSVKSKNEVFSGVDEEDDDLPFD